MRRTLITLGAIAMLVVGFGVANAASTASSNDSTVTATGFGLHDVTSLLDDVLADLVEKGTISQAQSDAIGDALDAAREAKRAEMEALHATMQAIVEDGVITTDELAQLPDDHPLNQLDTLLDDGQITLDELRGLGPIGGFGHRGGHGPGFWGPAPDATDDSSSGSADGTSAG